MAERRRQGAGAGPFDEERWLAGLPDRYRPRIEKMMAAFDAEPRRPDEERWRAALVEEILGLLQEGFRSGYLGGEGDHARAEVRVLVLFAKVQERIEAALAERRSSASEATTKA